MYLDYYPDFLESIWPESIRPYIPIIFNFKDTWGFVVMYFIIGITQRIIAKRVAPPLTEEQKTKLSKHEISLYTKIFDTWSRWPISLVNAYLCVTLYLMWYFGICSEKLVLGNINGYFLADAIVDQDLEYAFHHLSPMLMCSILFNLKAKFDNSLHLMFFVECGNVFAHTAAFIYYRSGPKFHKINTISFWISRPLGFYPAYAMIINDVPREFRFSILFPILVLGVSLSWAQQIGWMLKMIKPREKKEDEKTINKINKETTDESSSEEKTN